MTRVPAAQRPQLATPTGTPEPTHARLPAARPDRHRGNLARGNQPSSLEIARRRSEQSAGRHAAGPGIADDSTGDPRKQQRS